MNKTFIKSSTKKLSRLKKDNVNPWDQTPIGEEEVFPFKDYVGYYMRSLSHTKVPAHVLMQEKGHMEDLVNRAMMDYFHGRIQFRSIPEHGESILAGFVHRVPAEFDLPDELFQMATLPPQVMAHLKTITEHRPIMTKIRKEMDSINNTCQEGSGYYAYILGKPAIKFHNTMTRNSLKDHEAAKDAIVEFATRIFLNKRTDCTKEQFDKCCGFKIGFVETRQARHQEPHLDFRRDIDPGECFVLHAPMQECGSVICIWDKPMKKHMFVYIPYGCFLLLDGTVYHSGFYGNSGNMRFHLAVTRTKDHITQEKTENLSTPVSFKDQRESNPPVLADFSEGNKFQLPHQVWIGEYNAAVKRTAETLGIHPTIAPVDRSNVKTRSKAGNTSEAASGTP